MKCIDGYLLDRDSLVCVKKVEEKLNGCIEVNLEK